MSRGKGRPAAGPPPPMDEVLARYEATVTELRELIPEAHAAVKDLTAAIREAKRIIAGVGSQAAEAAHAAAQEELGSFSRHIQREMDRTAADMNRSIRAAQAHVIKTITPSSLALDADSGQLRVWFEGAPFDAGEAEEEPGRAMRRSYTAQEVSRGRGVTEADMEEFIAAVSEVIGPREDASGEPRGGRGGPGGAGPGC